MADDPDTSAAASDTENGAATDSGDVAPSRPPTHSPSPRPRSGARRWLFRIITVIAAPLLALVLLEGGLRVVGYGDPDTMFARAPDGDTIVTRSQYGRRFFPPSMLRSPLPHAFSAATDDSTYRIFILGGSAAKGVPEPAFSFARMLEVMLEEAFPERRFEVINTALTAINSHVVLPIAEECARYEPDLFIVYMGNNEVVGPYGPGTVFNAFTADRRTIRGSIRFRGTRAGQLLGDIAALFTRGGDELRAWTGMELFLDNQIRADDSRLQAVYAHLHDNLADIIEVGHGSGAQVIVCTVASNLKGCPPFACLNDEEVLSDETVHDGWRMLMDAARTAWVDGDTASAAANATEALILDDGYAEAHYLLGRSALNLARPDSAHEHLVLAREYDALRFRADGGVNAAIREAAQQHRATLVDIVEAVAAASSDGIPGDELFWEHVHLNFEGNYLVASALFDAVISTMPRSGESDHASYAPPSREDVAARLAYTSWNEFKMSASIASLMARPPFTNQLDHEQRLADRQARVAALRGQLDQDAFLAVDTTYQAAIDARPDDVLLRAQYASFLSEVGEREESIAQWRRLVDAWPDRFDWRTSLARVLVDAGRIEDAVREFELVAELTPQVADSHANVGAAYLKAMRFGEAAKALDRAIELNPAHAAAHAQLAEIAFRGGDERSGIEHLKKAVASTPPFIPAIQQLGWLLATHRDPSVRDPEESVRIIERLPDDVVQSDLRLLDALAAARAQLGEFEEAVALAAAAEQLAIQQNNPQAAQTIAARRAMYEQRRAFVMQ